jgi:plastocyanin
MLQKFSIFNGIFLVVSAIFLMVNVEVSTSEATVEDESLTDNKTKSSNNNTIILNAAEVGDEEQYRWVNSSDAQNPTLNIMANKDYIIKISNPTDEEHQLIIDSKADGKTSEIAKSKEIKPQSKNVEFNFKTDHVGELGYHCKYHPDVMKGTINVTQ